jgi:hypothetical protein
MYIMSFNTNGFILAGTAIAIFGVGLYIWDTRKDAVVNTYNQYRQAGGSKRHKKRHNKTYKKVVKR